MQAITFKSHFVASNSRHRPWSAGHVVTAGEQLADFINGRPGIRIVDIVKSRDGDNSHDDITVIYESSAEGELEQKGEIRHKFWGKRV